MESIETIHAFTAIEQIEQMARKPFVLPSTDAALLVATPESYTIEDMSHLLPTPSRKKGTTVLHDAESFIAQVQRHKTPASTIYVDADYAQQRVSAVAVFNDHDTAAGWRDHRATFQPRFTQAWKRWTEKSGKVMTQSEFGFFLEENLTDIADPAGNAVLEFVVTLQETRKVKYGSAVNLANGMVQIEFVEEGEAATKGKIEMFRKFTLGVRPFDGGDAYSVESLLRYRIDRNSGEIKFWFDLQRIDRVLEDACRKTVEMIRTSAGVPVLFGAP